ncbi:MAG: nucleotidyltransferase domain-containing protein [Chloroflexota bacterium]
MSLAEQLQARREERAALLRTAVELLKDDPSVVAAWLYGSMGRDTHDDWSDIDLWIVVDPAGIEVVSAGRNDFAARIGTVILTVEAPQNAPPGGAFMDVLYSGSFGPHIIDFTWQPQESARRSADTQLLFDRAGILLQEPPTPSPVEKQREEAAAQLRFFWMMAAIVAKNIARRKNWEVLSLLAFLWSVVARLEWLTGSRDTSPRHGDHPAFEPPTTPGEQLAALRRLTSRISLLAAQTPALRDAATPQLEEQIARFFETVEQSIT